MTNNDNTNHTASYLVKVKRLQRQLDRLRSEVAGQGAIGGKTEASIRRASDHLHKAVENITISDLAWALQKDERQKNAEQIVRQFGAAKSTWAN